MRFSSATVIQQFSWSKQFSRLQEVEWPKSVYFEPVGQDSRSIGPFGLIEGRPQVEWLSQLAHFVKLCRNLFSSSLDLIADSLMPKATHL